MTSGDRAAIPETSCGVAKEDEPTGAKENTADGVQCVSVARAVPMPTDHLKSEESLLHGDSSRQTADPDSAPTDGQQLLGTPTPRLSARMESRIQPSWQSNHTLGRAYANNSRIVNTEKPVQPPWQYSPSLGGQYLYNPQTDQIVLRNGQHLYRPPHISRASLSSASYGGPFPPKKTVPLPGLNSTYTSAVIQQQDHRLNLTNPERQGHGIQISSWDSERLDPSYMVRKKQFFAVGRVFLVLWSEPSNRAESVNTQHPGTVLNHFGEPVFSKVRRFVVVREGNGYCSALPINTYGGRGVAKPGIKKSEHAIVYTGRTPPQPSRAEFPRGNEMGMLPIGIRVDPERLGDRLDSMARLDLAAVHTVHHSVKAKSFGIVNQVSTVDLLRQFMIIWMRGRELPVPIRSAPNDKVGINAGDHQIEESEDDDDNETDDNSEDDDKDEKSDDHSAIESHSKEADKHAKLDSKGDSTMR